jgi:hypothetical protein
MPEPAGSLELLGLILYRLAPTGRGRLTTVSRTFNRLIAVEDLWNLQNQNDNHHPD